MTELPPCLRTIESVNALVSFLPGHMRLMEKLHTVEDRSAGSLCRISGYRDGQQNPNYSILPVKDEEY